MAQVPSKVESDPLLIRLHQGGDQSEATHAAREIYPNPVAVQNVTVDPRRTVGGFENDPQDGTYTEIAWVQPSDVTDVTDVRLL